MHLTKAYDDPPIAAGRRRSVGTPGGGTTSGVDPTPGPGINPKPVDPDGPNRTDVYIPVLEPLPHIMGACANVGAQIIAEKVLTSGEKLACWWICHGERQSITNLRLEGKPFSTFHLTAATNYNVYVGSSSQAVDPIGVAAMPGVWTKAWPWIAYVVARLPAPGPSQPSPDIRQFLCDVGPPLIPDPRLDATLSTLYPSSNPMLNRAYWWSSPTRTTEDGIRYTFGPGYPSASIDWSGSVTASANACDVDIGGGTKRFSIGLSLSDTREIDTWDEAIRAHAQMLAPVFNNGLWQFPIDVLQSPSGIALTDAGPAANIMSAGPLEVADPDQVVTRAIVYYTDDAAGGKESEPVIDDDPGIATGAVPINAKQWHLPGIHTRDQAGRIARYLRKRSALDKSAPIRVNGEGLQLLPGIVVSVTSAQLNWSNQLVIITDLENANDSEVPSAWDLRVELYDAALYDDTKLTATASAPPANPSPYDVPPEVLNLSFLPNSTRPDLSALYFDPPTSANTTEHFPASMWASTNVTNWTPANVNDGSLSPGIAFGFNTSGDSIITLDLGSGQTRAFRALNHTWDLSAITPTPIVEYSDFGVGWAAAPNQRRIYPDPPQITPTFAIGWDDCGAHRFWRFRKGTTSAFAANCYELQFVSTLSLSSLIDRVVIYNRDYTNGARKVFASYRPGDRPTATSPLVLGPIMTDFRRTDGAGQVNFFVDIVTVSTGGIPSPGLSTTFTQLFLPSNVGLGTSTPLATLDIAGNLALRYYDLSLSNGSNHNVSAAGYSKVWISGPTAAFGITGWGGGADGATIVATNGTAFNMSVYPDDTGSSSGNRIHTASSSTLVVPPYGTVEFHYKGSLNYWIAN